MLLWGGIYVSGFDNCTIGIRAEGRALNPTTVNIDDCRMINMETGIYLDGFYGNIEGQSRHNDISAASLGIGLFDAFAGGTRQYRITNNTLNTGAMGRSIGVYGTGLSNASSVEVDHNLCIDAGALGIVANTHKNVYVHDNQITVNGALDGIAALNGQYEIECNIVTGAADNGIYLWNATIRNDLSFNTVDGAAKGLFFELDCPGENFIECNTLQNNNAGLGVHYVGAFTGQQYNTGNRWIGTAGATFDPGMLYTPLQSRYDVPDQMPWKPVPVNPPQLWFYPDIVLTPPVCQQVCQAGLLPPGGGEGNQFDTGIAGGGWPGEAWDQWRRERYLLYKLAEYPELAPSGSVMSTFQNARSESVVGQLTQIGLQTVGLFATAAELGANEAMMAAKSAHIRDIDAVLEEALPAAEYDSLTALREILNDEVAALGEQNNAARAQMLAWRVIAADSLLAQLTSIPATQSFEQNEKTVLGIYLQSVARGHAPDATQLNNLKAIGAQCPREGGPAAVYMAAHLYEGLTGETVVREGCGSVDFRQGEQAQGSGAVSGLTIDIRPNPANDRIIVDFGSGQGPFILRVSDLYGRLLLQERTVANQAAIDTERWANGLYNLMVTDASGKSRTGKFILQH